MMNNFIISRNDTTNVELLVKICKRRKISVGEGMREKFCPCLWGILVSSGLGGYL
jgi:hypothetical protein